MHRASVSIHNAETAVACAWTFGDGVHCVGNMMQIKGSVLGAGRVNGEHPYTGVGISPEP